MTANISDLVEARWNDAIKNPTIPKWRTLAMMAAQIADNFAHGDPDNIVSAMHRGVYQEAYNRMIAMQPENDDAA